MERRYFNRELYSKGALLKAAYHFTDRAYIYLDQVEAQYCVELTSKDNSCAEVLFMQEFANELITQSTREEILIATANVRELILGRAFGSTIVDSAEREAADAPMESENEDVFADWFGGKHD